MDATNNLIGMQEVMAAVPYSRSALVKRIKREGIAVYISGDDRRRRLIARKDLPKLTEPRPVRDTEPAREFDGSGS